MKILFFMLFCVTMAFSHGLFYTLQEGKSINIHAEFTTKTPASYAKIILYEGDSQIPLVKSVMDRNGNFGFLPQNAGKYRVEIIGSSDHGPHIVRFNLNVDEKDILKNYDRAIFEKYTGILSAIGIIFGIFGVIALIKTVSIRKKMG